MICQNFGIEKLLPYCLKLTIIDYSSTNSINLFHFWQSNELQFNQ